MSICKHFVIKLKKKNVSFIQKLIYLVVDMTSIIFFNTLVSFFFFFFYSIF